MTGKLLMIGTPIGNIADMSPRAREGLQALDILFCEDTRVTGKLLAILGIRVETRSLHDDSSPKQWQNAISEALGGRQIGFVTDAGMPGVSDPGRRLVRLAWDSGVPVTVVPGPSSVGSLLACCPFVKNGFSFIGFAPRAQAELVQFADFISDSGEPVLFFDSPKRVHRTIGALAASLAAEREILIGRELTKLHEQLVLLKAQDWPAVSETIPGLGEFTIAVSGCPKPASPQNTELKDNVLKLLDQGFSKRDAVLAVSVISSVPLNKVKSLVYGNQC